MGLWRVSITAVLSTSSELALSFPSRSTSPPSLLRSFWLPVLASPLRLFPLAASILTLSTSCSSFLPQLVRSTHLRRRSVSSSIVEPELTLPPSFSFLFPTSAIVAKVIEYLSYKVQYAVSLCSPSSFPRMLTSRRVALLVLS